MRQYIGARYMPKFLGTYDSTTEYEALSVVDNGQGTNYVSNKPVPAGIPLSNRNYWQIYGSSSGAIIDLQNQIDTINTEVDELQKNPTNRKYILIGDSFSCGIRGGGQTWVTGWADYAENILGNDKVFRYNPGGDPAFEGVSAFTSVSEKNFIGQLNFVYENKLGSTSAKEITDIIVFGGTNEVIPTTTATIAAAIDTFCARSKELFPNANIKIACLGLDARTMTKNDIYQGYILGSQRNGCEFISELLNLGTNKDYDSGYGHWSEAGYNYYNPIILEAIVSGYTHFGWYNTYNLTLGADVTISGSINFLFVIEVNNKGVFVRIIDSYRYRGYTIKNNKAHSGGTLSVEAFVLNSAIYTAFLGGGLDNSIIMFNSNTHLFDNNSVAMSLIFDQGNTTTHKIEIAGIPSIPYNAYTDIAWCWNGTKTEQIPVITSMM